MKRTEIAGIDVGTAKISSIMADTNDTGTLRILGVGVAPSNGLEKGVVFDFDVAGMAILQSVKRAEKMAGCRLKSAYVGISGTDAGSRNNHGVVSIPHDNKAIHNADRKRALEIARSIEVPDDQTLLHVMPRSYTLDGQRNIQDPVGMYGFRLDVETHIVMTSVASIQNVTKCIRNLDVGIGGLLVQSLASAEAVLTEDERQNGVVIADIGAATTDIAAFKDGSVYHTSTLPVGGNNITNDISLGLGLSFDLAEEMKKKDGNVTLSEENGSKDVIITESGQTVCYQDLRQIIEARVEEIIRLIVLQLPTTDYIKTAPSGLVLTGGTSNLTGMAEFGCKLTRFPVRIGVPVDPDGKNDTLCDPCYAASIGLIYWQMKNKGSQDWSTKRWDSRALLPRFSSYLRYIKRPVSIIGQRR